MIPEPLDLSFEGFAAEAFAILGRLRERPRIEQYREEKDGVRRFLREPFTRFRDDLVVNFVLPNRLDFETERNVFSRILKNDFGAGGSHHHLWMAFYRPERRRLTDVQLSHSIDPDGFETGLFVGGYAYDLVQQTRARIEARPEEFLARVNPLLGACTLTYRLGAGQRAVRHTVTAPLDAVPAELVRADALWLRRRFGRDDVLAWRHDLVRHALDALVGLWPLYRFLLDDEFRHG